MASLCDLCGTTHERTLCDTAEQVRRVQAGEPPLGYLDGTIYIASAINHATPEQIRGAALLAEARQERDEARAIASEEREHIRRLRRELGETRGELDTLREAARALVAGLPGAMFQCFQCDATAMHGFTSPAGGVFFACDDHNVNGSTEMDHAPALRRLRELTKEGR